MAFLNSNSGVLLMFIAGSVIFRISYCINRRDFAIKITSSTNEHFNVGFCSVGIPLSLSFGAFTAHSYHI